MRKSALILAIPLAALLATPSAGAVDLFGWKPFGADKKAVTKSATPREEAAAADDLRRGEALENQGSLSSALKVFRQIAKSYELTAAAPKAQLHVGHILARQGDYDTAFKAYTEYTTKYPRGTDFDTVMQAQFNIAKMYLGGQKTKILGVRLGPSYKRAEEMFGEIVKRAPFHHLAPTAQFNVGQALEKQGNPEGAIAAYKEVITRYAGDPVADDAQYQLGYVRYRVAQDGSNDQAARQQARESFEEFVNRHPRSEKVPQAQQNIKVLTGAEIKGTLGIAKFYDKTKNYKAAVVYYNELLRNAPGSPESELARKRIGELKNLVGADVLRAGPEKAQSGEMALEHRRAQARVDVASRPDFNGPYIPLPPLPDDGRPKLRTTPGAIGPVTEPALPTGDPLQDPLGGRTRPGNPLLPLPTLPPLTDDLNPSPEPPKKDQ